MSYRESIARLLAGPLPGQMSAAEVAAVKAADAARSHDFNVMSHVREQMRRAGDDRALAAQGTQETLDRYGAFQPVSDRNAQLIGRYMREHDDALKFLQGNQPISYGAAGAGAAGLGGLAGSADPAQAAQPATFDQRWWPQP